MKAHPANQVSRKHPSSHLKSLCVYSQLHWIKPIVLEGRGKEKKHTILQEICIERNECTCRIRLNPVLHQILRALLMPL